MRLSMCTISSQSIPAQTYKEWCRYRFMSILRHLAPLGSCSYMFNEQPYACAKRTNYSCSGSLSASIKCHQPLFGTEIRELSQLFIRKRLLCKEMDQLMRFLTHIIYLINQCLDVYTHAYYLARVFAARIQVE